MASGLLLYIYKHVCPQEASSSGGRVCVFHTAVLGTQTLLPRCRLKRSSSAHVTTLASDGLLYNALGQPQLDAIVMRFLSTRGSPGAIHCT